MRVEWLNRERTQARITRGFLRARADFCEHAWQPEQEVMREARRLLLAAGKDVE